MRDRFILLAKVKILGYAIGVTYVALLTSMILEQIFMGATLGIILTVLIFVRLYYDIIFIKDGMKGEK